MPVSPIQPQQPAGNTPQVPQDAPLDDEMEIIGGDLLHDTEPTVMPRVVKTRELVAQVQREYAPALLEAGPIQRLFYVITMSLQFWAYRLGALPGLELLRRPLNASTLLVPAIDSILNNRELLGRRVPTALEGIDLDQVKTLRGRLLSLRDLISRVRAFLDKLEALSSHLEQSLDTVGRSIYKRAVSPIVADRDLSQAMQPLVDLATKSALEGVETKKSLGKARKEGHDEAIAGLQKQKEAAGNQGDTKDQPPPPIVNQPALPAPARSGQRKQR